MYLNISKIYSSLEPFWCMQVTNKQTNRKIKQITEIKLYIHHKDKQWIKQTNWLKNQPGGGTPESLILTRRSRSSVESFTLIRLFQFNSCSPWYSSYSLTVVHIHQSRSSNGIIATQCDDLLSVVWKLFSQIIDYF